MKIRGERHYLWRAVDQDGDVIDILVQRKRNARAAKRFFRKLLKGQGSTPWQLVTDKLKSYGAAHRVTMSSVRHSTGQYENNTNGHTNGHTLTTLHVPWFGADYLNDTSPAVNSTGVVCTMVSVTK